MSGIARTARRHQQRAAASLVSRLHARLGAHDRGDVPGWVLITLMTAGLVTVLWAVAGEQLEQMFVDAIGQVTGPGSK